MITEIVYNHNTCKELALTNYTVKIFTQMQYTVLVHSELLQLTCIQKTAGSVS